MKVFVLHIVVISLLCGCAKSTIKPGKEFDLKYGNTSTLHVSGAEELNIQYSDLTEESRCAPGVECIWAGRVAVELKLNESNTVILGLNHEDYPTDYSFENYEIRLLEVNYNSEGDFGNKEKSSLRLIVEK